MSLRQFNQHTSQVGVGCLIQLDGAYGVVKARIFQATAFPCPQEAVRGSQQEASSATSGFEQAYGMQLMIIGVTNEIKHEFHHSRLGEHCTSGLGEVDA